MPSSGTKKASVKLAASRVGRTVAPREADPCNPSFDAEAARRHFDGNVERTLATYRMAGEAGADLVISTEDIKNSDPFIRYGAKNIFTELAEELPGPTSEKLSAVSKRYGMYTASNYYVKDGGAVYNAAVLIGRDGEIIGAYKKIHMPAHERWMAEPGCEYPVFDTDIGVIGISICYDLIFPEHTRILALNGADIVLHLTGGWGFAYGDPALGISLLQVRAAENAVYMATSYSMNALRPDSSSNIISNEGYVLAENRSLTEDGIAIAEFSPDYDIMRERKMWTFFSNVPSTRARIAMERMPETYAALTAPSPALVGERYSMYKYARTHDEIKDIAAKFDEYRQDSFDGRDNKLDFDW